MYFSSSKSAAAAASPPFFGRVWWKRYSAEDVLEGGAHGGHRERVAGEGAADADGLSEDEEVGGEVGTFSSASLTA